MASTRLLFWFMPHWLVWVSWRWPFVYVRSVKRWYSGAEKPWPWP